MAVGVWDPGGDEKPSKAVSLSLIQQFVELAQRIDETVSADDLAGADVAEESWVMTQDAASWQPAEALASDDLVRLARLFTIVEQQVPGWDAGKTSPVIALVKILKQRDEFAPELRKWIKAHTDNRYLPNGSAL